MEILTTQKWALDTAHSEVQFKVRHLVISTVTGTFKVFGGSLESNGRWQTRKVLNAGHGSFFL